MKNHQSITLISNLNTYLKIIFLNYKHLGIVIKLKLLLFHRKYRS